MYANYLTEGGLHLGWWDGGILSRLAGPPTDMLLATGFPPVPEDAPAEDRPYRFAPAVLRPGKIVCLMKSYRAHAEEMGAEPPPAPNFFAKLTNTLIGHGDTIRIPADVPGEVHHEGELALVIGRGGASIPADEGLDHVAALTVANDVTARTLQFELKKKGWPWLAAKSRDTFLPLGPGLLPRDRAPDPGDLRVVVRVNGEVRQDGSTSRLLWPIGEIVAAASRLYALSVGDVILTGTPEGVGPIESGDRVEVEIPGVGLLANPVE